MKDIKLFCENIFNRKRRKTNEVKIGNVLMGSMHPVRVQTMVTTLTSDIKATVEQCMIVADAGAELVRVTVPTISDAEALGEIRKQLREKGYNIPLVADIHFNAEAAFAAAYNADKVRINPGNFTDKQAVLSGGNYDEAQAKADTDQLRDKFTQLLTICKEQQTALRIGVNHGSLSGRIMALYGDTPEGMTESAMEFLRICKEEKFDNVVVSMKSGNTSVMIRAYRMLVAAMNEEDMRYPLHLGVTEAGDGEDGRIKSAVGIGTLMADGLGDTIRVSLTEAPENEIPVAKILTDYFKHDDKTPIKADDYGLFKPYEYKRYETKEICGLGGRKQVSVIADLSANELSEGLSADIVYLGESNFKLKTATLKYDDVLFVEYASLTNDYINWLKPQNKYVLIPETFTANKVAELRACFLKLQSGGVKNPVIIKLDYDDVDLEALQIKAACDAGALLTDGFGDGLMICAKKFDPETLNKLAFSILQAARVRFTKTEYIACPGCGRTLFELRETLAKVKAETSMLTGLKIAVMGCIVNGPGEMADADYGYVGAGPGKVTLYKGKDAVKKNIPQEKAVDELISIIKENGDWPAS